MSEISDKVSVWWDIETSAISDDMKESDNISCNIKLALKKIGFHGEITIYVYGNTTRFFSLHRVLDSNGLRFFHVPPGKDAALMRMIVDMIKWGHENPAPAAYLLISGDISFQFTLEKLVKKGFEVMLAKQENAHFPNQEKFAAVWGLESLLSGGDPSFRKVD